MRITYEACVTSVSQGLAAASAGADRLELCARIATGGVTPPMERLAALRRRVRIPIHVMIRPRPGDFCYSPTELLTMRTAIGQVRDAGADGVVVGVLRADRQVDVDAMARLMEAASGLAVTFHRAYDLVADPVASLPLLGQLGVDWVLTAGGAPTAAAGHVMLNRLVRAAAGRIGIIAGGAVRAANVRALLAATGIREVHAHLRTPRAMRSLATSIHQAGP